ncbi:MAG: PLP-dependent aminotransferase family protein [Actinomycetota bacterium]|nr:PLP-dependent aminotransferase family protein [Actinomycetota bacterium]
MPGDETNHGPELLLTVRRSNGAPPLGRQIEAGLRTAIRQGRLSPGQRLPPTRTLAADLDVSRRLVLVAFEQLAAEGWLDARVGSGTYVRRTLPLATPVASLKPKAPERRSAHSRPRFDFFPGHPDLGAFPRAAWGRAAREALRELPDAAFGYGDPRGHRELRVTIASMLARARGVVCRPGQVVICQGVVQALGILVRATAAATDGAPVRVAVEDPYLPEHRDVLLNAGADVVPVPVDELGVHDEAVAATHAALALLTPAHQCPTGAVLSAGRRAALAGWAQREHTLIVEDDYDAEYRYDRSPIAALQGLAPDHVAYVGSVSKTLAPGVRLAWLVVPEERLASVIAAKRYADAGSPILDQATLAQMIASGDYDRHVRAARRRQRERRDALVKALATHLPAARIGGVAAGLHAVAHLDEPVDAAALVAAARTNDVGVYPLSLWRADPPPETSALVLGYGALHPAAISEGVRRLADALHQLAK